MKTKYMRLENFFSHVDTEFYFDSNGITLISGKNGSGKSSFLPDGFCYGYFGQTLRGVSGASVINNSVGKNCRVTIRGETKKYIPYEIVRTSGYSGLPTLSVQLGDESYTGVDFCQEKINTLIVGMTYKSFVTSRVFGKGDSKFFTQLTDKDRKSILDEFMGTFGDISIDRINDAHELAKYKINYTEEKIKEFQQEKSRYESEIITLSNALEDLTSVRDKANVEYKKRQSDLQKVIDGIKKQIEINELKIKENKGQQDCVSEQKVLINKEIKMLRDQELQYTQIKQQAEKYLEKQKYITATIEDLKTKKDQRCTSCYSMITEENIVNATRSLEDQIQGFQTAVLGCYAALKKTGYDPVGSPEVCNALENTYSQYYSDLRALEKEAIKLDTDRHHLIAECSNREKELDELQNSNTELKLTSKIEEYKATIQKLKEAIVRYHSNIGQQEINKNIYKALKSAYSNTGIKSIILDSILPLLNDRAQEYSTLLTKGGMVVLFDTQKQNKDGSVKESFDVRVIINDKELDYKSCSDGQRRRIDIITTLSLGDVAATLANNNDVVILDEVFDGLDQEGINSALELLSHLSSKFNNIYVITHDETLASRFENIINITLINGRTVLQ